MQIEMFKKWVKSVYRRTCKRLISLREKTYTFQNHKIRYINKKTGSSFLCVVFSAMPPENSGPLYNYIRTLKSITNYDLLYILDDMVKVPGGGGYYLGSDHDYWGYIGIPELIEFIAKKNKNTTLVTVGSSKGGTCALMYGALVGVDYAIVGACQYKIGDYMSEGFHIPSLKKLTGKENYDEKDIQELNELSVNALKNAKKKPVVYIHYSDREHTYNDSIVGLLKDLRMFNYQVYEDIEHYETHQDVGKYYPTFLKKTLQKIVEQVAE